jgi:hypothetical protein
VKFGQFGKFSATFGVSSAKIGGENKTARVRPFLTNFSQKNYCVALILQKFDIV